MTVKTPSVKRDLRQEITDDIITALDGEKIAWIVLVLIALLSRTIMLGARAMTHDESLHTVYSFQLFDGRGYQHQPMMHGPLKFILNPLMYFLFGVNDWSARIQVALFGVVMVAVVWILNVPGFAPLEPRRMIETIVPLLAGVHAAFLFSPEDEPGLEVTLACRRPLAWTILERLAWLLALQGGVALIGSVLIVGTTGETLFIAVSRWITPLVFFVGLGMCLTLMTRQAVISVGLITVLWCGLMLASEVLVKQWPFLWPIGLYLQPDEASYWLNRLFLSLCGLELIHLAATYFIRDDERVLLGSSRRQRSSRKEAVS